MCFQRGCMSFVVRVDLDKLPDLNQDVLLTKTLYVNDYKFQYDYGVDMKKRCSYSRSVCVCLDNSSILKNPNRIEKIMVQKGGRGGDYYSKMYFECEDHYHAYKVAEQVRVDLDNYFHAFVGFIHALWIGYYSPDRAREIYLNTVASDAYLFWQFNDAQMEFINSYVAGSYLLDKTSDKYGYVYLIKSPKNYYKIGRTKNPKDRRRTFSVKLPFEVEFLCLIQTNDMYALERTLHKHFKSKRVNGEWFKLDLEDLNKIKSLEKPQR